MSAKLDIIKATFTPFRDMSNAAIVQALDSIEGKLNTFATLVESREALTPEFAGTFSAIYKELHSLKEKLGAKADS